MGSVSVSFLLAIIVGGAQTLSVSSCHLVGVEEHAAAEEAGEATGEEEAEQPVEALGQEEEAGAEAEELEGKY